ncbi:MAG: tetratricopeptide repeat protein [Rhodospirillales bacterium]|nr:tetratricopeptide repeat protein [Rhodospirillales bacterium]
MTRKRKLGRGGGEAGASAALGQAFADAVAHYRQGRLAEAERGLAAIQRRRPDLPDVLHLLALIALQGGDADAAVGHLEKAVAIAPDSAELYNLLGGALRKAGRSADAIAAYRHAVALSPAMAEAHYNLANALKKEARAEEAIEHYRRAVALKPDFADAHYNLGLLLRQAGRAGEAAAELAEATRLNPRDAEAFINLANALADGGDSEQALAACEQAIALKPNLARAHFNRGNLLRRAGRNADAIASFRRALAIDPAMAEALNNLGEALLKQGEAAEAVGHFLAALERQPRLVKALNNLGNAQTALGELDDAVASYRRALAIEPDYATAHTSLGNALHGIGEFSEAIACHRRAVALDPDLAAAHHNLGLALLLGGNLKEGWAEFEWRWRLAEEGEERPRPFPQPPWQGEPLKGKTILVVAEQGVGDEILYAGMVPDLLAAGARVVLECAPRLVPLFRRSFAGVACVAKRDVPAAATQSPDIDYQATAGNLGRWLRPELASFPGQPSYLVADAAKRTALREKYNAKDGDLLVGVAWISKNRKVGRQKSMTLRDLAPLAAVPGVTLVDLQYGDTAAERRTFEQATGTTLVHDAAVDQMASLDDFAAQVAAMDLVITVSNTTAHMAGALGVPAWVMLHVAPLNCWLLGRDDSLWYPSAQLFRQSRRDEWPEVVCRVTEALSEFVARPRPSGT